jgi:hypothetical protein
VRYAHEILNFLRVLSYVADTIVKQLQDSLAVLSPELVPLHQRLVAVRRQLVALAAKEGIHKAELKPLQEELRKIDSYAPQFTFLSLTNQPLKRCLNPDNE